MLQHTDGQRAENNESMHTCKYIERGEERINKQQRKTIIIVASS
jgi:hypothetical protein